MYAYPPKLGGQPSAIPRAGVQIMTQAFRVLLGICLVMDNGHSWNIEMALVPKHYDIQYLHPSGALHH